MNSNPPPTPDNWEAALGRALKNLPERQAPSALLPSVMAQIQAREALQCPPDRSWWRWPLWLRVASAAGFIALLALLFLLGGHFWENSVIPLLHHWTAAAQAVLTSLASAAEAVFRTGAGTGRALLRWIFVFFSLLLLASYFTCIGVGTFIYRTIRK
jgi:hypothetical protein